MRPEETWPTRPERARPTVVDALLIMLVGLVVGALASFILFFVLGLLNWPVGDWSPVIVVSVGTVVIYASTLWATHRFAVRGRGVSWKDLGLRRPERNFVPMTLLAWLSTFVLTVLIAYIVTTVFGEGPPGPDEQLGLEGRTLGAGEIAWLVATSVIVAPVVEEIVFRGVLFRAFRARWTFWPAAAISGLLFGAVHFSLLTIPGLAVLGIALAWLTERFDSLYPAMLLHMLNNALAISALVITANSGA